MRHRLSLNILASICSFAEIEVQPRNFSFIIIIIFFKLKKRCFPFKLII